MTRLVLPLLFVLTLASGASAGDPPPQAKTPEAFFELYQDCYDAKRSLFSYAELYDLSTPDSQILLFMRAGQEASFATRGADRKVDPKRAEQLEALLRKHGLDPAQKPLEGGPGMTDERARELFMHPKKLVAHLAGILKPVKDRGALIKGLLRFAYAQREEHSDLRPVEVKDLIVKGDKAAGRVLSKLTRGKESMSQDSPYFLAKVDGSWRYDLVAVFEDMVSKMKR